MSESDPRFGRSRLEIFRSMAPLRVVHYRLRRKSTSNLKYSPAGGGKFSGSLPFLPLAGQRRRLHSLNRARCLVTFTAY